jgi:L-malate glycosyltransferase
MRILLCCESYFPGGGGVARVNQEIAERLVRRGHEVTVATAKMNERHSPELNGVNIEQFAVSGNRVRGMQGETGRYQAFVSSGIFDAILIYAAQQWTFDALWPALPGIKARKIHVPCGYSGFYDSSYKEYFRQMPDILRRFDHLVFNASNYRDINFARRCGLTNFSVIANGASESEFERCPIPDFRDQWGIAEDEFIFLTVGSPPLLKGHREVALAYAQLRHPSSSLLILDGKYDPVVNPLLQTVPIKMKRLLIRMAKTILKKPVFSARGFGKAIENIRSQTGKRFLITDLPRAEIISAFFSSNLFVFASHIEYSPLVLFESAAAGLPFLSVPVGNAEEIVRWTKGGEICPASKNNTGYTLVSPSVLAQEMTRLATDSELLSQLGRQGRDSGNKNYSWERIVTQYEEIMAGKVMVQ